MNNKFDELTKAMAQSVTRRAALKKFGVGLVGMALACCGITGKAQAHKCVKYGDPCSTNGDCCSGYCGSDGTCWCVSSSDCIIQKNRKDVYKFCYPPGYCGWTF
jgi:hypothetical protein